MLFNYTARIVLLLACIQCFISVYGDTVPIYKSSINYVLMDEGLRGMNPINLAASSFVSHSFLSTTFENRFFLKELMSEELNAVFRYRQNAFSLGVSCSGYRLYGDVTLSTGFARSFGKHVAFGLRAYYLVSYASECLTVHSFTFDVSMYARLGKNCGFGFSVYNPARLRYGVTGNVPLPVRLHLDFTYQIGRNVLLMSRADWELKSQVDFSVGAKYKLKCLIITAMARFPNPCGVVCIDLLYRRFLVGISCHYLHPLGFVPRASFNVLF